MPVRNKAKTSKPKGRGRPAGKPAKKAKKASYGSFASFINRTKKAEGITNNLKKSTMGILDTITRDLFHRVATEAANIMR